MELVAGEAEKGEVIGILGRERFVEGFKALELVTETALRGCVDDEDDLVAVLGEGIGLTLFCRECY